MPAKRMVTPNSSVHSQGMEQADAGLSLTEEIDSFIISIGISI
jgi:hypothetical protein